MYRTEYIIKRAWWRKYKICMWGYAVYVSHFLKISLSVWVKTTQIDRSKQKTRDLPVAQPMKISLGFCYFPYFSVKKTSLLCCYLAGCRAWDLGLWVLLIVATISHGWSHKVYLILKCWFNKSSILQHSYKHCIWSTLSFVSCIIYMICYMRIW